MVAYGPAAHDAAANVLLDPAAAPDRAGDCDGRRRCRRCRRAWRRWCSGSTTERRSFSRPSRPASRPASDRVSREFHDGTDHPPAGHCRRLRRKPRRRAAADAVGARRLAACGGAGRDRRTVSAHRPERPDRDREEPAGPPDADLLRLHPLPGRVPDRAVRDVRGAAGDGQGRRSGQRLFRLGRSGARHQGGDEGLSVELRSAFEGPDRRSRTRWPR